MNQGSSEFTLGGLASLVARIRSANYEFMDFSSASPEQNQIFFRIDVDLDLSRAVEAGRIIAHQGGMATFFILVSSPVYNIMSRDSTQKLMELLELRHAIGLHFDPEVYQSEAAQERGMRVETDCLENVIQQEITAMSWHKPGSLAGRLQMKYEEGRRPLIDTYESKYFEDIEYVSDSQGWWRFGSIIHRDAFLTGQPIQLLLHPIWWSPQSPEHPLNSIMRTYSDFCNLALKHFSTIAPNQILEFNQWPNLDTCRPHS
jgi:hypothetical protein